MPKITEHGGATASPWDEPTAVPSEDEYTAAMQKHGTDEWTDDDRTLVDRYQASRMQELETRPGGDPVTDEVPTNATVEATQDAADETDGRDAGKTTHRKLKRS